MNKRDTYMKLEFEIYNKKNNNELILMAICKGDKFEIVENNNKAKVRHSNKGVFYYAYEIPRGTLTLFTCKPILEKH